MALRWKWKVWLWVAGSLQCRKSRLAKDARGLWPRKKHTAHLSSWHLHNAELIHSAGPRPPSILLFFSTVLHAKSKSYSVRAVRRSWKISGWNRRFRCRRAAEIIVQAWREGGVGEGRGGETMGPGGYLVCKHAGRVTEIDAGQSSRRCGSYLSLRWPPPPPSRAGVNCESRFCLCSAACEIM